MARSADPDRRPAWQRWRAYWRLVLAVAVAAAIALWLASYGVAR